MCHTYRGHTYIIRDICHFHVFLTKLKIAWSTWQKDRQWYRICMSHQALIMPGKGKAEYCVRNETSFQHWDSQNAFQNPAMFTCIATNTTMLPCYCIKLTGILASDSTCSTASQSEWSQSVVDTEYNITVCSYTSHSYYLRVIFT